MLNLLIVKVNSSSEIGIIETACIVTPIIRDCHFIYKLNNII